MCSSRDGAPYERPSCNKQPFERQRDRSPLRESDAYRWVEAMCSRCSLLSFLPRHTNQSIVAVVSGMHTQCTVQRSHLIIWSDTARTSMVHGSKLPCHIFSSALFSLATCEHLDFKWKKCLSIQYMQMSFGNAKSYVSVIFLLA